MTNLLTRNTDRPAYLINVGGFQNINYRPAMIPFLRSRTTFTVEARKSRIKIFNFLLI